MVARQSSLRGRVVLAFVSVICVAAGASTGRAEQAAKAVAYDPDRTYPVEALRQDVTLLRDALWEAHPSLHWYTPEHELEAAFAGALARLDRPMTERDLLTILEPIIALIRCGHTHVQMSKASDEAPPRPSRTLPLRLWSDGARLFVLENRSTDDAIRPGDEILSVNRVPAAKLVATARATIASDGYNEAHKRVHLNFGRVHQATLHHLGIVQPFAIEFARPDGTKLVRTVHRPPVPGAPPPPDAAGPAPNTMRLIDGATALLTSNGFNDPQAKAFHRRVFAELAERNVQNLIIDLRLNTGGNGDDAIDLMSYLVDAPFRYIAGNWARVRHPERPSFTEHLDARKAKLLVDNFRFRRTHAGRHHFDTTGSGMRTPSGHHRFRGRVYLLTGGRTFSSAALLVAALKAQRDVTIVGQETGGGQAGASGGINQRLTLPNTKLIVGFPLFRVESTLPPNGGRGVQPDRPVKYGWRDVLAGKDLELETALALIGGARDR